MEIPAYRDVIGWGVVAFADVFELKHSNTTATFFDDHFSPDFVDFECFLLVVFLFAEEEISFLDFCVVIFVVGVIEGFHVCMAFVFAKSVVDVALDAVRKIKWVYNKRNLGNWLKIKNIFYMDNCF